MTHQKPRPVVVGPESRAYPHNLDAERAILGAALQWPDEVFGRVGDLAAACFYRPEHAALWDLLCDMRQAGEPIDLVSVPDRVMRLGAARFGGVAGVCELPDCGPAWANVGYYAGLVRSDAKRRAILAACEAAAARAYGGLDDPEVVVDDLIAALVEVCE